MPRSPRWTFARSTPRVPRRSATGSPPPASSRRFAAAPAAEWSSPNARSSLDRRSSPSGASSSSWSLRASSSDIPRCLEVLGEDLVRLEGGGEALDLLLHVGANQDVEIVEHRLRAAVERLVQAVDDLLLIAAAAVPLALRAAEGDVPLALTRRRPIGGVDEVRVA